MDKELVTIIIPVYNRKNLVHKAIEAAINQTYRNIEIIIGDNCSNDGTWDVLKEYSKKDHRISIFRNETNIGPVKNWHKCLNRSNGKFVKLLFSDDWIDLDFIEKTLPLFSNQKSIGFVITTTNIYLNNKIYNVYNVKNSRTIVPSSYFIFKQLFRNNMPVSPGCALFRKSDVDKFLYTEIENPIGIDFALNGAGIDLLLYLELCNQYEYFGYSNSTYSHFNAGTDSLTYSSNLEDAYLYSKIYFVNLHPSVFRLPFKIKLFFKNKKKSLLINGSNLNFSIFTFIKYVFKYYI